MSALKDEILEMVASINNEQLLEMVKADIEYFHDKSVDIIDELKKTDREELMNLLNEPDEKDAMTEDEYKAAKWRAK